MDNFQIELIKIVPGIIGAITGIISLIWHMKNTQTMLKLEYAYFERGGFGIMTPRGAEVIGVEINLRNLGNNSTTIEKIYICFGKVIKKENIYHTYFEKPITFKPLTIAKKSSKLLKYEQSINEKEYQKLFNNGETDFKIFITHTFGEIKKYGKSDFKSGHYTIGKI